MKDKGIPIRTAARRYEVPEATLRHRLSGYVNPEAVKSGPAPLFKEEEEADLVNHLKLMAKVGYGYSRSEVIDIATNYAIHKELRDSEHPLSTKWYKNFMTRWPDLKIVKPRSLEMQRAKASSEVNVQNYYSELHKILEKYDLFDKPERIYNVDEKGICTNHKSPYVIAATGTTPPTITSGDKHLVTVLGCGNAQGHSVPPFFVFPGNRMRQELLENKSTGADGDVSESGWSNTEIFHKYMENHLLKYIPHRTSAVPVLVLFDGHKSHISMELIEWAKKQNIILFVLPAHTSHILQPMDVECFGPFERIFNNECHKFMRQNCSQPITRYNICGLACKGYLHALSPSNLQSAFRKTGIYPYDPNTVDRSNFAPAQVFIQEDAPEGTCEPEAREPVHEIEPIENDIDVLVEEIEININNVEQNENASTIYETQEKTVSEKNDNFFEDREKNLFKKKPRTKQRRYLSKVVSGKAITEDETIEKIKEHKENVSRKPSKKSQSNEKEKRVAKPKKSSKQVKPKRGPKKTITVVDEPCASTSGLNLRGGPISIIDDSMDSDVIEDEEPCCVCKLTGLPLELRKCNFIVFASWGQCTVENCGHWVHLKYCCQKTVLRRHDTFVCPCHGTSTEE